MFAMKSMDKHLLLKLDMVYRSLSMEEAQKRFEEIQSLEPKTGGMSELRPKTAIKRKVVKTINPTNK